MSWSSSIINEGKSDFRGSASGVEAVGIRSRRGTRGRQGVVGGGRVRGEQRNPELKISQVGEQYRERTKKGEVWEMRGLRFRRGCRVSQATTYDQKSTNGYATEAREKAPGVHAEDIVKKSPMFHFIGFYFYSVTGLKWDPK